MFINVSNKSYWFHWGLHCVLPLIPCDVNYCRGNLIFRFELHKCTVYFGPMRGKIKIIQNCVLCSEYQTQSETPRETDGRSRSLHVISNIGPIHLCNFSPHTAIDRDFWDVGKFKQWLSWAELAPEALLPCSHGPLITTQATLPPRVPTFRYFQRHLKLF
jgi:hypothetical protein